jgi:carboxylesterase
MRVVGEALSARGVACRAPLLPGHGTTPRDLDDVRAEDWLEAGRRALDEIVEGPRFLVGCSMGGLLALALAAERDDVVGVVALAPALMARPPGQSVFAAAERGLWRLHGEITKADPGGDIESLEARRINPSYETLPVKPMAQLLRLQRMVEERLPDIRVPLCVLHGRNDRTIHPDSARRVFERCGARWAEHHLLPRSRHVLGLDVERDRLSRVVVRFVDAVLAEKSA